MYKTGAPLNHARVAGGGRRGMHLPILRWGLGWGRRGDRWGDRRGPRNETLGGVVPPRDPHGGIMKY